MPGTAREVVDTARRLARMELAPDLMNFDSWWADGTGITEGEWRELIGLMRYERGLMLSRYGDRIRAQRKAMRLLRRYLTPEQRRQLNSQKLFYFESASGNVYRMQPITGTTWQVRRHGRHYYGYRSFCLHDFPQVNGDGQNAEIELPMPAADVTLAHLLLLSCDEEAFLREANATDHPLQMWDGEYLKRMRRARIERERREVAAG